MSARPGEEHVINRAMHMCNPPVSWRENAQEMTLLSSRSKSAWPALKGEGEGGIWARATTSLHKDFVSGELSF